MGSPISFRDTLIGGLRSTNRAGLNEQKAKVYQNWKPEPEGLRTFPQPTTLITGLSNIDMPFPQLFRGMGVTLLAYQNSIHLVDESNWTSAVQTIYDLYSTGSATGIPSTGGTWHFVDLRTGWMAFDGITTVLKTGWLDSSKVFQQSTVTIQTGCSFRGRILCGGFGSDFWDAAGWSANWDAWLGKSKGMGLASQTTPGQNWVGWSSVGVADMPMMILLPTQAVSGQGISGAHNSARPLYFDLARRNEMGMMPMDWQGEVWHMKALTSGVVVYGKDGVSALLPATDPYPTFGLKEDIHRVGIASRNAVGGDQHQHLFIDENGVAWMILSDFSLTRLGFEEQFEPIVDQQMLIHFDPNRREFYIAGEEECWVLGSNGSLAKVPYLPVAMHTADKGSGSSLHIIPDDTATTTATNQNTGLWQSEIVRLDKMQTIQKVELRGTDNADISVKFEFRNNNDEAVMTSSTVATDDRGVAYLPLSCIEFSLILTASNTPINAVSVKLDDIIVHFAPGNKISLKERVTN